MLSRAREETQNGKEVQRRAAMCICMADSLCSMAENSIATISNCKATILQEKKKELTVIIIINIVILNKKGVHYKEKRN